MLNTIRTTESLIDWIINEVEEVKGQDVTTLDVTGKSSITNAMIIVTGTSTRHIASMAELIQVKAKGAGVELFSCSGKDTAEWVILDFGDAILHLMQQESRDLYALEKLWG
ncbi:ribosome silencing factor [Thorsellia kenyensis]|uniref:Ribosomal silencing factor RsfS n=1 Tax=Thorsellia kenyensis TaxID=1549888 RepID=A0ABV6C7X1_9GAMM